MGVFADAFMCTFRLQGAVGYSLEDADLEEARRNDRTGRANK